MDEAKKSSRCWRYSKNFCVVMAGAAAICNVVVGTYLYYSVDFQDVVRRIDSVPGRVRRVFTNCRKEHTTIQRDLEDTQRHGWGLARVGKPGPRSTDTSHFSLANGPTLEIVLASTTWM